jgi:hypothetical protein
MPTVQATITRRSVSEPRTKAMASASAIPIAVSSTVSGTSTVSEGPSRLARMCDTGSPVLQALPKSKSQDLLHEDPQLDIPGLVQPELGADVGDGARIGHLARQQVGRVAADPVEQHEHQHDDAGHGRQHLPQAAQDISKHRGFPDQTSAKPKL